MSIKPLILRSLSIFIACSLSLQAAPKPNIVVIFADDLGYGDLGCYGAKYKTPHLDKLATEGFRSEDFQVPANVCSPSRSALLTGRYPMRNGHPFYRYDGGHYGLHPDEITVAELLKTADYRTFALGKWHLGYEMEGSNPLDHGFDSYFGLPYNYSKKHNDYNQALFRDREMIEKNIPFTRLTPSYNKEVVKFINEHDGKQPFFIYLAHQIAHTPIQPNSNFKGATKKGKYADFVYELDHSTGVVLKALKEKGLDQNTLVVFLADNGHTGTNGSGGPLSGGKYTTMEGGHRVPAIFRWTGTIPAGQVSQTALSSMDLLPLFCEVTGVAVPSDRTMDGYNIFPILKGESTESPHKVLYYYNGLNLQAVREGSWKLHLPRTAKDQPYWGKGGESRRFLTLDDPFLVNLDTDLAEKKNVAPDHPEVVARLLEVAKKARTELGDVNKKGEDQRPGWPPAPKE